MIESICQNCGTTKVFSEDKLGKKYKCSNCGNIVLIEKIDANDASDFEQIEVIEEIPASEENKKNNVLGKAVGCIAVIFAVFFLIACIIVTCKMLFK